MNRKVWAAVLFVVMIGLVYLLGAQQVGMALLPEETSAISMDPSLISFAESNQMLVANCESGQAGEVHVEAVLQDSLLAQAEQKQLGYTPRQRIAYADRTNYGERFTKDVRGRQVGNDPIVVLHETVGSASGVIGLFQTRHPRDDDQVSYHTLIALNGTIIYMVPPNKRAFGAGNSVFQGPEGLESVQTNPKFPGSVNNFAYHISLETPPDGIHNGRGHRGYTEAQYQSLGWLVAKTGVPDQRITTHKAVDRSGSRRDPRSFSQKKFLKILNTYPRADEIGLACSMPSPLVEPDTHASKPGYNTPGNTIGR
ncbi:hypothetical protein BST81_04570 [Leptolyngbya sp. 'hensonii']|uniref:peptidoglycan recognition protein family protein n=1 Tax=Leptolyngbya sp. 'hensonii' TaxID=1922337 RepID=UPI00095026EE|nr:peptidoglycan recognition family protein [Leptolyngbya sp. 'hensonii']OLP19549.1 hypothetical protein BST81_04570 [Leptolyngbya sp. 'hensonii']